MDDAAVAGASYAVRVAEVSGAGTRFRLLALALGLELGLCDAREMHLVGAVGEP